MAISKGIALTLDLGTPSCSRVPLTFDLGPQLAKGAPGSSIGASLTPDLGNLTFSRGQLALDMGPYLGPGAMVSKEAPLILGLDPLAIGANCLLIWSSCLLHGAPSIGSWSGGPACSRGSMTHGLHSSPVGFLFSCPACSRGPQSSWSRAPAGSLLHWLLILSSR